MSARKTQRAPPSRAVDRPPPPPAAGDEEPTFTVAQWIRFPASCIPIVKHRAFVRRALEAGATGGSLREAAKLAGVSSLVTVLGSARVVRALELLAPLELDPAAAVALLEPLRVARLIETSRHGPTGAQRIAAERELADRYGRPNRAPPGIAGRGQRSPGPGGFAAARAADRERRASRAAGASPTSPAPAAAGAPEQLESPARAG